MLIQWLNPVFGWLKYDRFQKIRVSNESAMSPSMSSPMPPAICAALLHRWCRSLRQLTRFISQRI